MSAQFKSITYPLSSSILTLIFSIVTGPKYFRPESDPGPGIIIGACGFVEILCMGKRNRILDDCGA